jgi:hypothetical protein
MVLYWSKQKLVISQDISKGALAAVYTDKILVKTTTSIAGDLHFAEGYLTLNNPSNKMLILLMYRNCC